MNKSTKVILPIILVVIIIGATSFLLLNKKTTVKVASHPKKIFVAHTAPKTGPGVSENINPSVVITQTNAAANVRSFLDTLIKNTGKGDNITNGQTNLTFKDLEKALAAMEAQTPQIKLVLDIIDSGDSFDVIMHNFPTAHSILKLTSGTLTLDGTPWDSSMAPKDAAEAKIH